MLAKVSKRMRNGIGRPRRGIRSRFHLPNNIPAKNRRAVFRPSRLRRFAGESFLTALFHSPVQKRRHDLIALANHRTAPFTVKSEVFLFLFPLDPIALDERFPVRTGFVAALPIMRARVLTRQHGGTLHSEQILSAQGNRFFVLHPFTGLKHFSLSLSYYAPRCLSITAL